MYTFFNAIFFNFFCSLLLKANARVNARNAHQQTPLHLASKYNQKGNVVMLLLNSNTKVAVFDVDNKSPLHYCNSKIMDIFLKNLKACQVFDIEKHFGGVT